ncbi:MAG: septal ring lytic transglycosylase RlpA family protein [Candidatus Krumholzibacteriia bacterium]|nr:septal ring lytic transglycosylase RlpA family protein [bacterium]MCB9514073.1 septal ring lytic transglycosylase RlpA family protein [Candidatus Latescibacterota bacterium]MCB9515701.1 septal ring lytic transglycosylase RlpA family protein [Candidatus Latescibacterota bacterium]
MGTRRGESAIRRASRFARIAALGLALALGSGCSPKTLGPPPERGAAQEGLASWYGAPYHGRQTASGEIYDQEALTAAHRALPFGTQVRVTNLKNGRSLVLRINDRGPFVAGRIVDVSRRAARELGFLGDGVAPVRLEVLGG